MTRDETKIRCDALIESLIKTNERVMEMSLRLITEPNNRRAIAVTCNQAYGEMLRALDEFESLLVTQPTGSMYEPSVVDDLAETRALMGLFVATLKPLLPDAAEVS